MMVFCQDVIRRCVETVRASTTRMVRCVGRGRALGKLPVESMEAKEAVSPAKESFRCVWNTLCEESYHTCPVSCLHNMLLIVRLYKQWNER